MYPLADSRQILLCVQVHKLMLDDKPRTEAYKSAICSSKMFKDKVVLDVGAGTGVCMSYLNVKCVCFVFIIKQKFQKLKI
jgi:predicted RNA methylase